MGSCNLNVDPLEGSALTNQRPRYDLMYSCTVSSCKTSDYPKNKPSQKKIVGHVVEKKGGRV